MAENDLKNKIMQTTPRQKFIVVFIVIVVLIIVWQIIGLFGGGSSSSPPETIKPIAKMNSNAPGTPTSKGGGMPNNAQTMSPTTAGATTSRAAHSNTTEPTSLTQGSIVNDPQFVRMQRVTEEKYMGKLNELEELRIQRQIAETNQAIAAAKLATVTAEKDISDLLTRPAQQTFNGFPGQQPAKGSEATPPTMPEGSGIPIPQPQQQVLPYVLTSVSMILNKWSAVISFQGTMYIVGVGDILPPDGSIVTSISKNSVTIRKDGKSRRIGITTSIER